MKKQHTLYSATSALKRKNDVMIEGNTIFVLSDYIWTKNGKQANPKKKHDLGNGSWGRIDYLRKCFGFNLVHTGQF